MFNSTLCYLENDRGEYLMLHRVKKKNDVNQDKWIGVGGKFEGDESPDECLLREVKEETGVTLTEWKFRGVVTFSPTAAGKGSTCTSLPPPAGTENLWTAAPRAIWNGYRRSRCQTSPSGKGIRSSCGCWPKTHRLSCSRWNMPGET